MIENLLKGTFTPNKYSIYTNEHTSTDILSSDGRILKSLS